MKDEKNARDSQNKPQLDPLTEQYLQLMKQVGLPQDSKFEWEKDEDNFKQFSTYGDYSPVRTSGSTIANTTRD